MLQRIASGSTFSEEDRLLSPLNEYLEHASKRFAQWFMTRKVKRGFNIPCSHQKNIVTDVEDPEEHFNMDSLTDQVSTHKPVVYLSPTELFHLHYTIQNNLEYIEPNGYGILSEIVNELGESYFRPDIELPDTMVRLALTSPYEDLPLDPESQLDQLLVDAKRLVVYVIKIQSGPNLARIIDQPITAYHEKTWDQFKEKEFPEVQDEQSAAVKRRYLNLGRTNPPVDLKR